MANVNDINFGREVESNGEVFIVLEALGEGCYYAVKKLAENPMEMYFIRADGEEAAQRPGRSGIVKRQRAAQ